MFTSLQQKLQNRFIENSKDKKYDVELNKMRFFTLSQTFNGYVYVISINFQGLQIFDVMWNCGFPYNAGIFGLKSNFSTRQRQ